MLSGNLSQKIADFGEQYVKAFEKANGQLPITEFDENWPSPCITDHVDEHRVTWKPVSIEEKLSFTNVEQALNLTIHPDISSYYTSLYSDNLSAHCSEGKLSLLFPWSEQDFTRLQENIIGHILMKQKLRQDVTIFFAVTDQDEYFLSVNNQDGSVWVERVGCKPHKRLADSLADFFNTLTPAIDSL